MSGLVAVWHRDRAPLDRPAFDRVMMASAHRGVDGRQDWTAPGGDVALGHLHFWTTPEEVGEAQPLVSGQVALTFDGRIDNRTELAEALGTSAAEAAAMSDAALVLRAYERWDTALASRLLGPFALVVWDGARRRLLCARDPLGRRTLFYQLSERLLVVASEPGPVLGGDTSGAELDDVFLAHYFAVRRAPRGHTMFESVHELPPAYVLEVTDDSARESRYWSLDAASIRFAEMSDYSDRFLELLDRAVARRLRAPTRPGVMMSGGIDSTSVAALAASRLQPGTPLNVYSYVFDDLTELDEREWMQSMVDMYKLDQTQVMGDYAWPLSDFDRWRWNSSGPERDAFGALNERLFAAARGDGRSVLLTGALSDALVLAGYTSWLADLVADGHYREAAVETARHVRQLGAVTVLRSNSVRRLVGSLSGRHEPRRRSPPPWLTPRAAERLTAAPDDPDRARAGRRTPDDIRGLLDAVDASDGISSGAANYRIGVDVRDPFADLELVRFAAAVPAYTLYHHGTVKFLLRAAMGTRLPPAIHARRRRSDISALYWRGMAERIPAAARALLDSRDARWRDFVLAESVSMPINEPRPSGARALVPWRCITFEWWQSACPPPSAIGAAAARSVTPL